MPTKAFKDQLSAATTSFENGTEVLKKITAKDSKKYDEANKLFMEDLHNLVKQAKVLEVKEDNASIDMKAKAH